MHVILPVVMNVPFVFVPQGHPGKEGPGGTKGNQVRTYNLFHNYLYTFCICALFTECNQQLH